MCGIAGIVTHSAELAEVELVRRAETELRAAIRRVYGGEPVTAQGVIAGLAAEPGAGDDQDIPLDDLRHLANERTVVQVVSHRLWEGHVWACYRALGSGSTPLPARLVVPADCRGGDLQIADLGTPIRLLLNDGRGRFTTATRRLPPTVVSRSFTRSALVDVNGAGALVHAGPSEFVQNVVAACP